MSYSVTFNPFIFSETCTQLPNIDNLISDSSFPINYGQLVTVKCDSGYILTGKNVITCIKDSQFSNMDGISCYRSKSISSTKYFTHWYLI